MSELATGEIESPPKLSRAPHVGVEPFTPPSGAHERRDRAVSMDCGLRAGVPWLLLFLFIFIFDFIGSQVRQYVILKNCRYRLNEAALEPATCARVQQVRQ